MTNRTLTLLLCCSLFALTSCDSNDADDTGDTAGQCDLAYNVEDVTVGEGSVAKLGQNATLHYDGYLCDESAGDNRGDKFDSSIDRGQPFSFIVGASQVIDGWDEGIPGMKVGGTRILTIPPDKAYGSAGVTNQGQVIIPPNATLIFEVELLDVN